MIESKDESKDESKTAAATDPRILQVAKALAAAVRTAGRSRLSLERQLDLSSGYLSKILGGTVELRMRHVLMILDALEVDPAEFFRTAFPRRIVLVNGQPRRLREDIDLPMIPEPERFTNSEIDEQVKRSIARLLGLMSGAE